jgi:hypothetical protein
MLTIKATIGEIPGDHAPVPGGYGQGQGMDY